MSHLSTLQSTWTNQASNSVDGRSEGYQGIGVFKFTFDDAMPASAIGGTAMHPNAIYKNAVTAASFSFNNQVFSLDQSADNIISIIVLDDDGTDASIELPLRDANNTAYLLDMKFADVNRQFNNYALSNLIGLLAGADTAFLRPAKDDADASRYVLHQQSPLAIVRQSNIHENLTVH